MKSAGSVEVSPSPVVLRDYLATRRTVPANQMGGPGPDRETLDRMLTIAARVPDHGKLAPWRFIVFEGPVREALGERFVALSGVTEPPEKVAKERNRFTRAPVVVAVVSTAAPHAAIPEWEQTMSAGAVCMNLVHAAPAFGFSAQWLSEWIAYDQRAKDLMGIAESENVAGFIHIGTPTVGPTERPRPALEKLVTRFELPREA
ncbi:MAG: nitroreductase [Pseudomonadota bacterium]